jgi:hypothetical protein
VGHDHIHDDGIYFAQQLQFAAAAILGFNHVHTSAFQQPAR